MIMSINSFISTRSDDMLYATTSQDHNSRLSERASELPRPHTNSKGIPNLARYLLIPLLFFAFLFGTTKTNSATIHIQYVGGNYQ